METPIQQAARLLIALNELMDQEGMHLREGSFELVAEVRKRAGPLVRHLVTMSGLPGVSDFRPQVTALVERSAHHAALLQEKMEEFRAEIRRTNQARHRAVQLVPAYARPAGTAPKRFLAAG
jgi:hypothetical protein